MGTFKDFISKVAMGLSLVGLSMALAGLMGPARAEESAVSQSSTIWLTVPSSGAAIQAIKVEAPAEGNIMVTVTGTVNYMHPYGTQGHYCLSLSETAGDLRACVPDEGSILATRSYIAAAAPTSDPNYGDSAQYSIIGIWHVKAHAKQTFFLNGYAVGMSSATYLFQPSITALYIPGTLSP